MRGSEDFVRNLCTLHFKNLGLIILSIDADPDVIRIGKLHFANSDPDPYTILFHSVIYNSVPIIKKTVQSTFNNLCLLLNSLSKFWSIFLF